MGKFFFVGIFVSMIKYVKILPLAKLQPANQAQFKQLFEQKFLNLNVKMLENLINLWMKLKNWLNYPKFGKKGQDLVI